MASTIADLRSERKLEIGDRVKVGCTFCCGSGKANSFDAKRGASSCWRCAGKGYIVLTMRQDNCPCCNADLHGDQIAYDSMEAYGSTHFGRALGIYRFDMTVAYQCPDCGDYWNRFTRKPISAAEVFDSTFVELVPA